MNLSDYKKEILGAIIGGLLTAALSLAVGLYNLNKSFELTIRKDQLYSLKTDIYLLRNVEKELDENVNLLLNNTYKIEIETEEIELPNIPVSEGKDKTKEREFNEFFNKYLQQLRCRIYKVTKIQHPPDEFIVNAWQLSGPPVSNINFELIQKLNELYRKLSRINKFIVNANGISDGMIISESTVNSIKNSVPEYNNAIADISQKNILNLKNEIAQELIRLHKERSGIVL